MVYESIPALYNKENRNVDVPVNSILEYSTGHWALPSFLCNLLGACLKKKKKLEANGNYIYLMIYKLIPVSYTLLEDTVFFCFCFFIAILGLLNAYMYY